MSGNNLSVRITADIVDLQTKFAVAKAEVSGLTAEMNKLARASAAGTIDSAGTARLQQLAGDLIQARSATQGYAAELEKAGVSLSTFGRAATGAGEHSASAVRYVRELFDEISSGRTRYLPSTLASLGQTALHMNLAMLAAAGGVAALVGGLGYLAYRAFEAGKALDQMEVGAQFAGNMNISRSALQQFSDELAKTAGISSTDAREIVGSFASMHDMSAAQVHALELVTADFARATGDDATKAKDAIIKMFSDRTSAVEYARSLGGVTQAQIEVAQTADQSGDAQAVFAAKFDLLNSALDRTRATVDKQNSSITAGIKNWIAYTFAVQGGMTGEEAQAALIEQQNQARAKQLQQLEQLRAAMAQQAPNPDVTLKTGVETAEKENPISEQANEAAVKIGEMNAALEIAKERGDEVSISKLNDGLAKAKEELSNLQFGPVLDRMREQMEQVAATWDGTQSALLRKQLQIAQQTLSSVAQGSKEYLAIKQAEATKEIEIRRAVSSEALAAARAQVAGLTGDTGTTQRLEAEEQIWQKLLAGDQLNAAAREEVQRSYNADVAAIARAREAEQAQIARSNANTDIAISRLNLEATKNSLDAQVAATKEAVAQKYAALKTLADQEFALDLQALNDELAILPQESAAYAQVYGQIRELKAKLVAELAALDREQAAAAKQAAKEQASDWRGIVGEIEQSESGMVSDILTKRKSLSQSLEALGAQLVTKEIANDVKAFTTQKLLHDQTQALEQGGILFHLLAQSQQTAATVQAQSAQTGAVIAGNSARNAATASAAAAGKAASAASGGAQVLADAAKAFSGTYASVSQIPVVGWLLAPPAAAAAYAAVAAYEGLASLDVGTNYVPRDMLAQIHEGEAVVPKAYNPAASGGAGAGGALGGDTHNYGGGNTINVSDTSLKRMLAGRGAQRDVLNALAGAYRRGARPR